MHARKPPTYPCQIPLLLPVWYEVIQRNHLRLLDENAGLFGPELNKLFLPFYNKLTALTDPEFHDKITFEPGAKQMFLPFHSKL